METEIWDARKVSRPVVGAGRARCAGLTLEAGRSGRWQTAQLGTTDHSSTSGAPSSGLNDGHATLPKPPHRPQLLQ